MSSESERDELERLLGEVREISDTSLDRPTVEVTEARGAYRYVVHGHSSHIERDEVGRISRIVGPGDVKTIIRDEGGMVTRIDTEVEEIIPE